MNLFAEVRVLVTVALDKIRRALTERHGDPAACGLIPN